MVEGVSTGSDLLSLADTQIIVGNEFILNEAGALNASAAYTASVTSLLERVADVRQKQTTWGLSKELLIGTSDAGSTLSTSLATGIDFFMANVHPFFGDQPIQDAATWTWSFFENFNVVSGLYQEVEIRADCRPLLRLRQTSPSVISPRLGGLPTRRQVQTQTPVPVVQMVRRA